jgi:tryptophan-rich sensory protein
MLKRILKLVGAVAACQLAGVAGSFFTVSSVGTWYASLAKPAFTPPDAVFGPVWTTLYLLMGIAAFLVWDKGWARREVKVAGVFFVAQLVLNILWSGLFFGLRSPWLAFVEIVVLWLAIAITTLTFYRVSKPAALLFVPYWAWVSFAAALNFEIMRLSLAAS